jgi:hypothetical protein
MVRGTGDRAARPGWIPSPNRSHPDALYVTGSCLDRATKAEGRQCALEDAARQIQRELGSPRPVEIKGSYVEDEYSELRASGAGEVRDHWVLVAFPRKEVRRQEDRIADRVALGLSCEAEGEAACDTAYAERVESAMTRGGMAPAPQRLEPALVKSLEQALARAAELRAARLLLVELGGRFLSEMEGEFYAEARCQYRLIDGVSGKVQDTFESGPVKGGHIAKGPAVRKALDNCTRKLVENLTR